MSEEQKVAEPVEVEVLEPEGEGEVVESIPGNIELAQAIVGLGYNVALLANRVQLIENYLLGEEEVKEDE